MHRKRYSCFQHPLTGAETFDFPMVSGFLLDPMHLIDGGVIKDLVNRIEDRLGSHSPGGVSKATVLKRVNAKINIINLTKITELCHFR